MNEAETRAELIDPALKAAGWGVVDASRISREAIIIKGRLQGAGKRAAGDSADYDLTYPTTSSIARLLRDAEQSSGLTVRSVIQNTHDFKLPRQADSSRFPRKVPEGLSHRYR